MIKFWLVQAAPHVSKSPSLLVKAWSLEQVTDKPAETGLKGSQVAAEHEQEKNRKSSAFFFFDGAMCGWVQVLLA